MHFLIICLCKNMKKKLNTFKVLFTETPYQIFLWSFNKNCKQYDDKDQKPHVLALLAQFFMCAPCHLASVVRLCRRPLTLTNTFSAIDLQPTKIPLRQRNYKTCYGLGFNNSATKLVLLYVKSTLDALDIIVDQIGFKNK